MAKPVFRQLDYEKTSAPLILILGQTGSGKSHFCNKVLGEDVHEVEESARLTSCQASLSESHRRNGQANDYSRHATAATGPCDHR